MEEVVAAGTAEVVEVGSTAVVVEVEERDERIRGFEWEGVEGVGRLGRCGCR